MADPTPPDPTPATPTKFLDNPLVRHALQVAFTVGVSLLTLYLSTLLKVPVPPLPPLPPLPDQSTADKVDVLDGTTPPPAPTRGFGWVNDPEARQASAARFAVAMFADTPAGRVARGSVPDTFLWRALRKAAGHGEDWYPNINQLDVGDCVGCGYKHGGDVCEGVQVAANGGEWKPLSVEVIYGLSRVDIGKGQMGNEDGSMGAWAQEAVRTIGTAAMQKYQGDDLSTFDTHKARTYGAKGVPADIKAEARNHPVKATALVKSWADVQKAVGQGYPVAVCSDVGFENPDGSAGTRDKDGFCKARGNWPHCMCFIAVRGGSRPGAFCLNSWGDDAHRGPVWPADAPKAGFWVDSATVDRMAKQGDTYSLSDMTTFEARKLDWLIDARPVRPDRRNPFELALAP